MILLRSIHSELIKRRGSALNWLILAGSLFIPAIILVSRLIRHSQTLMLNATDGVWLKLFDQNWQYMSVFLLPMGISLVASLINQLEYRNNTWKQVYLTPQSFSTIFAAKYLMVLLALLQFFILFNIEIYLTAVLPSLLYADVRYPAGHLPLAELISRNAGFFINSLPIVAIQFLLSFHLRNFVISIGIGFSLLVASLIAMSWKFGYVLPYSYVSLQFINGEKHFDPSVNLNLWALSYFLIFSVINYLLFCWRMNGNFFRTRQQKRKLVLVLMPLILLTGVLCARQYSTAPHPVRLLPVKDKIAAFEHNFGAFIIENNLEWSIQERMKHYKVPGLSIAVVNNYTIEWARAYGYADLKQKKAMTVNTAFIPGSLSKSVNGMGLMKLVQDGKVDLFTDINSYLCSWKFPYDRLSKGKKMTLAHLLSHTAGLGVPGFYGYAPTDSLPTLTQIVDGKAPARSAPVRALFEPGKKMQYSGGGIVISELLLCDVTDLLYERYMDSCILKPLGMNHSTFRQYRQGSDESDRAVGYDSLEQEIRGRYRVLPEQAAAGLWTTPGDMCRFLIEIQQSLKGRSNKLLDQRHTEMMLTPYLNDESALGFFIKENEGADYFGHDAGNRGYSGAFYGSMDKGYGLAVFINSENSDILKEVINDVADVYGWPGFERKKKIREYRLSPDSLKHYTGQYAQKDENGKIIKASITLENNSLYYLTGTAKMKIYFTGPSAFITNETMSEKNFTFDKRGQVTGLTIKRGSRQLHLAKV